MSHCSGRAILGQSHLPKRWVIHDERVTGWKHSEIVPLRVFCVEDVLLFDGAPVTVLAFFFGFLFFFFFFFEAAPGTCGRRMIAGLAARRVIA